MSWDVSIINFSRPYESVEQIPHDEEPLPLGTRKAVHEAVLQFFPSTSWNDPAWGVFDSPCGSIEFNLGSDDPAQSMMLHVRASNKIVPLIVAFCKEFGWSAIDSGTGEFLERSENPEAGLETWRAYRDQVFKKYTSS